MKKTELVKLQIAARNTAAMKALDDVANILSIQNLDFLLAAVDIKVEEFFSSSDETADAIIGTPLYARCVDAAIACCIRNDDLPCPTRDERRIQRELKRR